MHSRASDLHPGPIDALLDRTVLPGYGSIGYRYRARYFADLSDAVRPTFTAVVTGANSGIGKAIAAGLCGPNATVVLAVRDRERGARARAELLDAAPAANVRLARCDVSDPDSVRACARGLNEELPAVDALIHNAGVLPPERTETAAGHELSLATHILGPMLLTHRLLPALTRARAPRVIFVSSGGMYTQRLVVDDPEYRRGRYRGATAYARTKRMQVALAPLMAEHYAQQGLCAIHSMHPGWVDTPGIQSALPGFHRMAAKLLRDPNQGADTAVWLATTTQTVPPGKFWHDRRIRSEHYLPRTRYHPERARLLWRYCARAAGISNAN